MSAEPAKAPTPAQLANLWIKTGGRAWEPPSLRHPSVIALIEGGWVKVCTMRCGFEAFDTGLKWTDAARAYFAAVEATHPIAHLNTIAQGGVNP
jgi:hypothetical protein